MGVRQESGLRIDAPPVNSIGGARNTQMRQAGAVFHAAKKQRVAVRKLDGPGIEDAVDGIRPIVPIENWIARKPGKQCEIRAGAGTRFFEEGGCRECY